MHTQPTSHSHALWRPLPLRSVSLTQGFWKQRQAVNRQTTLRHGHRMLEESGTLNNFRLAAGQGSGEFKGWVFQDSDAYKWMEAMALELANGPDPDLESLLDQAIAVVAAAQQPDGYLNTHFQVAKPGQRWTDLEWAHELYCAGHLIEAGIAHHRATGQTSLFTVARRFADHIDTVFGPGQREAACGHPEIELALVELYRETGENRYRDLAAFFIDQRGRGKVSGLKNMGPAYMQERVPVREAEVVEGHAVRQLYLNSGVADLYLETGEPVLLEALRRLWRDMTAHKMYLTGGFGARAFGESFGEAYDLPSREAYCETCAAIAAMMWNWRMSLATGEARFADLLERSLYNGFLSGVALDGQSFYYENPLHSPGGYARQAWFSCACCPPNVMRQIALVGHYAATTAEDGIQIHQYTSALVDTSLAALRLETDYPWQGRVQIVVESTLESEWQLSLRVPGWCQAANIQINGQIIEQPVPIGGYFTLNRRWRAADTITLDLLMQPRLTQPHPRIDAIRGCVAMERGPLVYCLEGLDQESGVTLSDVQIDPAAGLRAQWQADLLGGVTTIRADGALIESDAWGDFLYQPLSAPTRGRAVTLTAVPYFAWANREPGPMRVWIPLSSRLPSALS